MIPLLHTDRLSALETGHYKALQKFTFCFIFTFYNTLTMQRKQLGASQLVNAFLLIMYWLIHIQTGLTILYYLYVSCLE